METKKVIIENISSDYKGITYVDGIKCFVDETIAGDFVEINIYKKNKNYYQAKITKILEPSKYRNCNPECIYYNKCGGCTLQHLNIDYYYNSKKLYVEKLLNTEITEIFKVGFHKRRRVNIKYKDGIYGFYEKNSNKIVSIDKCINLTDNLNNILSNIQKIKLTNLDSVDIFEVDNGVGINLIFNKEPIIDEFKKLNILEATSINYTLKNKDFFIPITKRNNLFLNLDQLSIKIPNNFFMQATKDSQDFMINKICGEINNFKLVYDLYCGIGTYSFPLSKYNKKVVCFEGDDLMIKSINENINLLKIKNLLPEGKDLYNQPITDFNNVDAVVINPPRNGAGNQCKFLKNVKKIVYVSCNPESFKRDFESLKNYYKIDKLYLIDQFFYTNHLEIMVVLDRL